MYCTLIIIRYPKHVGIFGFLSMALFRPFLWLHKKIQFFKLMGSGKNGAFDIHPDFNQWALLFVTNDKTVQAPKAFFKYWNFFRCDIKQFLLQPIEGFGYWDKKKIFGELPKQTLFDGPVAVLTRATIRLSRLKNFWSNVDAVANTALAAKGLIISYGIGEVPWVKQATFSIWESKDAMKNFAYSLQQHKDVIYKTRNEGWYKEEMFVRFRVLNAIALNDERLT